MSKAVTVIRDKLDELIGEENVSGTTSASGATDKTTAVDVSLARYPDDYFSDWYFYETVAAEERKVKSFLSPSGTLTVWEAFTAQVATSKAYTLSVFSKAEKLAAINRALVDSYPYFYSRITGVLVGQHTSDKDDRKYALSSIIGDTFSEPPQQLYIHDCWYGDHDGDDDAAALTDSSKSWETNELIGQVVYNKTDGCYATITANTATTVTADVGSCSAGTDKDWDEDDEYVIPKNKPPERFTNYQVITGDRTNFYADVSDKKLILCVGQSPLTAFTTTDTSTTELDTDEQAEIVTLKVAANLYKMVAARVDSTSEKKYKEQAYQWEMEFLYRIKRRCMSPMINKIGIDWSAFE